MYKENGKNSFCNKQTLLTKSGIEKLLENSGYTWKTVKEITLTATMSNLTPEPTWGENIYSTTCSWFLESAK